MSVGFPLPFVKLSNNMKTRKFNYWVCETRSDSPCYNLRAKTKTEVLDFFYTGKFNRENYDAPKKVTIEYTNTMDLVKQLLGEGGSLIES